MTPKSVEPLNEEALRAFLDNQIKNVENTIIEDYSFNTFGFTEIFKNGFLLTNGYKSVNVELMASEDNYLDLAHNKYLSVEEKWNPKEIAIFEAAMCRFGKQFGFMASLVNYNFYYIII